MDQTAAETNCNIQTSEEHWQIVINKACEIPSQSTNTHTFTRMIDDPPLLPAPSASAVTAASRAVAYPHFVLSFLAALFQVRRRVNGGGLHK